LQQLRDAGHDVVEIDEELPPDRQLELTLEAMRGGASHIYQARLEHGDFGGFADFLVRKEGASDFGGHHYEVWDTKLARSMKPYFIIQLCSYSEMLEVIQGRMPDSFAAVLGDGIREERFVRKFLYYFRSLRRRFLAFHENFSVELFPHPGLSGSHGRWSTFAEEYLGSTDHLSKVANITRSQIKKLEAAGIGTMTELATTDVTYVPRLAQPVFERLKRQADLQFQSNQTEKPLFEVRPPDPDNPRRGLALLPPPSDQDVFFDIEGFPLVEDGLEYLLGAVCFDDGEFHDWWAHDQKQERRSFQQFIDWLHARWQADPSMHVYHYAPYETTALRRLMGKHATREREVDDLLRNQVFVDLYTVERQGLIVGTPGYSLKDIECI
jgi:predicted RecB family nuclease